MLLRVLYRTHAGANTKPRPDWYDRQTCLTSLRQALELAPVRHELTFLADGAMPAELAGEPESVVHLSGGSARRSFRKAVSIAQKLAQDDPADTFYWFAEDDYLYQPQSMTQLVAAAQRWPSNHYFTLYTPDNSSWIATHPSQPERAVPAFEELPVLDGIAWDRIGSSTSTLGMMRSELLYDATTLRFLTFTGSPFDGPTELTLQGIPPYDLRHVFSDLHAGSGRRAVAKAVGKPTMRFAVNAVAGLRRARRIVVAPREDLAVHAESGYISSTYDWRALAESVAAPPVTGGP